MKEDYSNYKVLIADDSRLVVNSVNLAIKQLGFHSDNIHLAYKPSEVIALCKSVDMDIIILDYNFNSNLNGHQIFYELSHYKSIKPTTIFVYVTGENALKTVKTILESGPDDYILKPFTQPAIKGRLRTIIKKKNSLMPIYERIEHNDFEQAITECDDLLPFFPQHNLTIRQLKSKSLISLKRYEEAKQEYQQLLKENS
ncbi:response regulator, partial [Bacteriovorax sp. DB6_IX]